MLNTAAAILMISTSVAAAAANDDLSRYIVERAAECWAEPTAMRGISFMAEADVSFTGDGQVSAVEILSVAPETETHKALAGDFAEAMKRCGPYATEGMSEISLTLAWPL
jgi:hypothetical protein